MFLTNQIVILKVNPNEQVNHHFVALVEKDGHLYELDGRKEFPVNHGPTSEATFLEVIRIFFICVKSNVLFIRMQLKSVVNLFQEMPKM